MSGTGLTAAGLLVLLLAIIGIAVGIYYAYICLRARPLRTRPPTDSEHGPLITPDPDVNGNHDDALPEASAPIEDDNTKLSKAPLTEPPDSGKNHVKAPVSENNVNNNTPSESPKEKEEILIPIEDQEPPAKLVHEKETAPLEKTVAPVAPVGFIAPVVAPVKNYDSPHHQPASSVEKPATQGVPNTPLQSGNSTPAPVYVPVPHMKKPVSDSDEEDGLLLQKRIHHDDSLDPEPCPELADVQPQTVAVPSDKNEEPAAADITPEPSEIPKEPMAVDITPEPSEVPKEEHSVSEIQPTSETSQPKIMPETSEESDKLEPSLPDVPPEPESAVIKASAPPVSEYGWKEDLAHAGKADEPVTPVIAAEKPLPLLMKEDIEHLHPTSDVEAPPTEDVESDASEQNEVTPELTEDEVKALPVEEDDKPIPENQPKIPDAEYPAVVYLETCGSSEDATCDPSEDAKSVSECSVSSCDSVPPSVPAGGESVSESERAAPQTSPDLTEPETVVEDAPQNASEAPLDITEEPLDKSSKAPCDPQEDSICNPPDTSSGLSESPDIPIEPATFISSEENVEVVKNSSDIPDEVSPTTPEAVEPIADNPESVSDDNVVHVETSTDVPVEVSEDDSLDVSVDVPVEVSVDEPVEKFADVPVEICSNVPVDESVDTPVKDSSDIPIEISTDVPTLSASNDSLEECDVDGPLEASTDVPLDAYIPRSTSPYSLDPVDGDGSPLAVIKEEEGSAYSESESSETDTDSSEPEVTEYSFSSGPSAPSTSVILANEVSSSMEPEVTKYSAVSEPENLENSDLGKPKDSEDDKVVDVKESPVSLDDVDDDSGTKDEKDADIVEVEPESPLNNTETDDIQEMEDINSDMCDSGVLLEPSAACVSPVEAEPDVKQKIEETELSTESSDSDSEGVEAEAEMKEEMVKAPTMTKNESSQIVTVVPSPSHSSPKLQNSASGKKAVPEVKLESPFAKSHHADLSESADDYESSSSSSTSSSTSLSSSDISGDEAEVTSSNCKKSKIPRLLNRQEL